MKRVLNQDKSGGKETRQEAIAEVHMRNDGNPN
jgi:hypothetical protein